MGPNDDKALAQKENRPRFSCIHAATICIVASLLGCGSDRVEALSENVIMDAGDADMATLVSDAAPPPPDYSHLTYALPRVSATDLGPPFVDSCSFSLGSSVLVGRVSSSRWVDACIADMPAEYRAHTLLTLTDVGLVGGDAVGGSVEVVVMPGSPYSPPRVGESILVAAADGDGELVTRVWVNITTDGTFGDGLVPAPDTVIDLPANLNALREVVREARSVDECAERELIPDDLALEFSRQHEDDPCSAGIDSG